MIDEDEESFEPIIIENEIIKFCSISKDEWLDIVESISSDDPDINVGNIIKNVVTLQNGRKEERRANR